MDRDEKAPDKPAQQRRRGEALENALLDAAWAELTEHGYEAFTIDAVAARAGTSRPVLYRRWADKHAIVRAAIGHAGSQGAAPTPNTGSLRGDVIALLTQANETRLGIATLVSLHLGSYYDETGTSLADLREALGDSHRDAVALIVHRAIERGDVDPARLTPRIIDVPFDLFRHQVLMTLKAVPPDVIDEIVDTVFLPLVTPLVHDRARATEREDGETARPDP